jgi:hypothetical protein
MKFPTAEEVDALVICFDAYKYVATFAEMVDLASGNEKTGEAE